MTMAERNLRQEIPDMSNWSQEHKILYTLVNHEGTGVMEVARAVGKSHSAISQYIRGTYSSPRALDPVVRDYLISINRWQEEDERYIENKNDSGTYQLVQPGFIFTRDAARVLGVCRRCWEKKEFGMITGDPGTGKTYTFKQLADLPENIPHIVITCDETSSKKSIMVETCEALGLEIKGASPTLLRRIVKHLKNNPYLLIYDEADLLKGPEVFEAIRAIYDKSETVGVVLSGNNNLAERLLMYAEDKPELARLRDRIGYYQRLTGLSNEEAEQFVSSLNATNTAKELLVNIGTVRGIRQLTKGVERCMDAIGGDKITEDLVQELGTIVLSFNA